MRSSRCLDSHKAPMGASASAKLPHQPGPFLTSTRSTLSRHVFPAPTFSGTQHQWLRHGLMLHLQFPPIHTDANPRNPLAARNRTPSFAKCMPGFLVRESGRDTLPLSKEPMNCCTHASKELHRLNENLEHPRAPCVFCSSLSPFMPGKQALTRVQTEAQASSAILSVDIMARRFKCCAWKLRPTVRSLITVAGQSCREPRNKSRMLATLTHNAETAHGFPTRPGADIPHRLRMSAISPCGINSQRIGGAFLARIDAK